MIYFVNHHFFILSLKINQQMFQFTEQLIYFTNKHTYPGDHSNGIYSICRKKFGHIGVNGPKQAKNEFLIFFFISSPFGVCYEEAGYQFFRKDQGCNIYRCHH